MKKFDILVMGELNVDLILNNIQGFPKLGTEIIAKDMTLTMGSSSAIFACNAAAFGNRVTFLGKLGNDYFGNLISDSLTSKNVNTDFLVRSSDYVTGATVNLSYHESRAQITFPGAMQYLSMDSLTPAILEDARHLHISSLFLQPLVKKNIVKIFSLAKKHGLTTSLDTQWDPNETWDVDLDALLPVIDVFLPNEDEVLAITKKSSVEEALGCLETKGNLIVIKRGSKGSLASNKGKHYQMDPYLNSNVVDTIGAGDSFDSGFVSHFLKGHAIEQCLRYANLMGAINTTAPGGTTAFTSYEKIKETALKQFGVNLKSLDS